MGCFSPEGGSIGPRVTLLDAGRVQMKRDALLRRASVTHLVETHRVLDVRHSARAVDSIRCLSQPVRPRVTGYTAIGNTRTVVAVVVAVAGRYVIARFNGVPSLMHLAFQHLRQYSNANCARSIQTVIDVEIYRTTGFISYVGVSVRHNHVR